jgi:hypothetical protein
MTAPVDVQALRQRSLFQARGLGYAVEVGAPLVNEAARVRPLEAVVDRMIVLETLVGCATGLPLNDAYVWLEDLGLDTALTPTERALLERDDVVDHFDLPGWVYERGEALTALAWATSLIPGLDFAAPSGPELWVIFGEVENRRALEALRRRCRVRPLPELLAACDLARCLHRAVSQGKAQAGVGKVKPYVIAERRRGLEWLLGAEGWDSMKMKV